MICIENHERVFIFMEELLTLILQRYESHSNGNYDCLSLMQSRGIDYIPNEASNTLIYGLTASSCSIYSLCVIFTTYKHDLLWSCANEINWKQPLTCSETCSKPVNVSFETLGHLWKRTIKALAQTNNIKTAFYLF